MMKNDGKTSDIAKIAPAALSCATRLSASTRMPMEEISRLSSSTSS